MTAAGAILAARFAYPAIFGLAVDNRDVLDVGRNGARVAFTSVTYTLYDPAQQVVYTTTPTQSTSDRLTTVTIPAAELPDDGTITLGTGYLVRWVAVVGGLSYTFEREAIVSRRALHPVITDADFAHYPGIKRGLTGQPEATSLQPWIDEAWKEIVSELAAQGEYAHITCSADAFRVHHIHRVLAMFYRWRHSETPEHGSYERQADFHDGRAKSAWAAITFRQDRNRDGFPDGDNRKGSGTVLHPNAARVARTPRGPW